MPGPDAAKAAFAQAAGKAFPRMANFSFDYGDVHWTILDANATVDWTDRELRDWVEATSPPPRAQRGGSSSFHQPGFNSSKHHFDEQYMRILAPVFEAGKVDLVFCGHVHNYQRSYPAPFVPARENGASADRRQGRQAAQAPPRRRQAGPSTSRSTARRTPPPKA